MMRLMKAPFIEFDCRNGELTGGVKPVLKNLEIRPDDKNLQSLLKSWAADLAIKIFSDRVPDRNAVTTVIPIKGTLTGPDIQLWPAIFGDVQFWVPFAVLLLGLSLLRFVQ